jgi:predicted ester cyclase
MSMGSRDDMKDFGLLLIALLVLGCSLENAGSALGRNKELVRRAHSEVWSRGDMKVVDEIYEADFVAHWLGGADTRGREAFKAFVAEGRRRAPDLIETVDQIVAEGDLVVTRFTSRGTFASEPGEPSQRKEVTMQEIAIHRIRNGKIAEQWTVGAVPSIRHLDADAAVRSPR